MMNPKQSHAAAVLVVAATFGLSLTGATAQTTQDLVGRWGVAAYWNDSDAARVIQQAQSFCSKPYVISKGRNGGAVMFEAFHGRPQEVRVSGQQITALDGTTQTSKTISRWDGRVLVFSYDEAEAKRRYGNMVFVRCGA